MTTQPAASIAARVLGSLVLLIGIATAPFHDPRGVLVAFGIVAALLVALRPNPRQLARRALAAMLGVAALAMPIAIAAPARGALIGCRALLAIIAALAIAATIPSARFGPALAAIGVPPPIAAVIAGILRQTDCLLAQGRRLSLARRLRGARGAEASIEMLAALLTKSAERAERVELAMQLRGYTTERATPDVALRVADAPVLLAAGFAAVVIQLAARA